MPVLKPEDVKVESIRKGDRVTVGLDGYDAEVQEVAIGRKYVTLSWGNPAISNKFLLGQMLTVLREHPTEDESRDLAVCRVRETLWNMLVRAVAEREKLAAEVTDPDFRLEVALERQETALQAYFEAQYATRAINRLSRDGTLGDFLSGIQAEILNNARWGVGGSSSAAHNLGETCRQAARARFCEQVGMWADQAGLVSVPVNLR